MNQYSSNNYYLFDKVLYLLLFLIASCLTVYYTTNTKVIVGSLMVISICFITLWRLLSNIKKVVFDTHHITILHLFSGKKVSIQYSRIQEIQHIFYYPVFSRNTIIYNDIDGRPKKLKIRALVPNGEYLEFINWSRSMNKEMNFTFLPSDSTLKQAYSKTLNPVKRDSQGSTKTYD